MKLSKKIKNGLLKVGVVGTLSLILVASAFAGTGSITKNSVKQGALKKDVTSISQSVMEADEEEGKTLVG